MSETFDYDIFLSYSSKDKDEVRKLALRLKNSGLKVWFDEWEIGPGLSIPLKIEKGIELSRTLLLIMSANAFASDWVTLERNTILFRDPTNAQRRFIPLRLDSTPIKDTIKHFRYIDWRRRSKAEYQKLLDACRPPSGEEITQTVESEQRNILEGHSRDIVGVAITANGSLAISCTNKICRIWDLKKRKCIAFLEGHRGSIESVAMTPDGLWAISGSDDIWIWDLKTRECVAKLGKLEGDDGWIKSIALTPDARWVLSGSTNRTIGFWDLKEYKCLSILEGHKDKVTSVAITPDGQWALSGSYDKTVRLWNLQDRKCNAILTDHEKDIRSVAITPDARLAISGSGDETVRIWDLKKRKCLAILEGHKRWISSVSITPDAHWAISGSSDKTVRLWDLKSYKCLAILEGHTDYVLSVALTPDGRWAISGSDLNDCTLRVWDLSKFISP